MTHTLLIHQAFASKNDPGGTRHYELGSRLVAGGDRFTVIASDVQYITGQHTVRTRKLVSTSIEDGLCILRVYSYSATRKNYLLRVVSFLSFMLTSFAVALRVERPDLVMGTTPPIFQAVSAWMVAAVRRRPFLLEVRDLWPEFAIDVGLLKNPTLIRLSRLLERFLYSRADHLLVNSPAYRDYLLAKGVRSEKVSVIPNGVDPAMFDPRSRGEDFRERYGLLDKFVFTYAGALGMANNIDLLVEAAARLQHRPEIHILIVGDGKERRALERLAAQLRLSNITFTGAFAKSDMYKVLAASDACVAILQNILSFRTTYPNKVFDYMAAGRPTILAIDGVIRDVIEAAHGGVFVPPGDADRLADAMSRLADDPAFAAELGARAREYVVAHFNREAHASAFASLTVSLAWKPKEKSTSASKAVEVCMKATDRPPNVAEGS